MQDTAKCFSQRIHAVGTLAHLRYETLDRRGRVLSTIEVRALVPSLPAFGEDAPGGPHGEIDCPEVCRSGLAPSAAHLIARGGTPGALSRVGHAHARGTRVRDSA